MFCEWLKLSANTKEIDRVLEEAQMTAKEYCDKHNFSYTVFRMIYESNSEVNVYELAEFSNVFNIPIEKLLISE